MNMRALCIVCAVAAAILVVGGSIGFLIEILLNIRNTKEYKEYNGSFADIFRTAVNPYKEKKQKKHISLYPFVVFTSWPVFSGAMLIAIFYLYPHINGLFAIALAAISFPVVLVCFWSIPALFYEIYIIIASFSEKKALRKISKIREKYLGED